MSFKLKNKQLKRKLLDMSYEVWQTVDEKWFKGCHYKEADLSIYEEKTIVFASIVAPDCEAIFSRGKILNQFIWLEEKQSYHLTLFKALRY